MAIRTLRNKNVLCQIRKGYGTALSRVRKGHLRVIKATSLKKDSQRDQKCFPVEFHVRHSNAWGYFCNFHLGTVSLSVMKTLLIKGIAFLALAVFLGACNKSPSFVSTNLSSVTAKFSSIKANILDTKCVACHSSTNPNGGVSLASYDEVMSSPGAVTPFQPHQSQLFWQCYKGTMPEMGSPLSALELQTLYDWIAYGAPNN